VLARREVSADVLKVGLNVMPELLKAATQIIQSGFASGCANQAILWTFPVTREQKVALAALLR